MPEKISEISRLERSAKISDIKEGCDLGYSNSRNIKLLVTLKIIIVLNEYDFDKTKETYYSLGLVLNCLTARTGRENVEYTIKLI